MNYQQIIDASNGNITGIHEYDQTLDGIAENIDINKGFCRALVILWLKAHTKRGKYDFWETYDIEATDITKPLLSILAQAEQLQGSYAAAFVSKFVVDDTTKEQMDEVGLSQNINDVIGTDHSGFADSDNPTRIAKKVFDSDSRFFILSIGGTSGNHSIGITRQYSIFGHSNIINVFDPNIGDLQVNGKDNFISLLKQINTVGYPGIDLNKNYVLWAFKD